MYHRLAGIAACKWRVQGRRLPPPILAEEHFASVAALAARVAMSRIVDTVDDPMMVLKGPEVASRYPDPAMRPYHDLDLLVEDSDAAHRALVGAGCTVISERPSPHHELPLAFGDLPVMIELHRAPKWPWWLTAPSTEELFASAIPSTWAGAGALAPSAEHHAVLLAAHSWAHGPLSRLRDLVDVEVMLAGADESTTRDVTERWGLEHIWAATRAAALTVLHGAPAPTTLRTWARNLPRVRRRSRTEDLIASWIAPFSALPPRRAARVSARATREMLRMRATAPQDQRHGHDPSPADDAR